MKKFIAVVVAVLLGVPLLFAHEMEGGSTAGLFGLKAEYVHVLLNPLPVYGLALGALVLAAAIAAHSRPARNIGLAVVVVCAGVAWPVLVYGQHGYNHLFPQLDTVSQQWLNLHMERAERFVYLFYITSLLGVGALATQKRLATASRVMTWLTLIVAIVSVGIGAWISRAGGQVSHSEFRTEEQPPPTSGHVGEHQHGENGDAQTPVPAGPPTNHSSGKSTEQKLPDTVEGIWSELHRQKTELDLAVNAGRFNEVQPRALTIESLAKKLAEIVHPDHKAAVQDGVDKINQAAEALQEGAHGGDQSSVQESLKRLTDALNQLEEQMKKQ